MQKLIFKPPHKAVPKNTSGKFHIENAVEVWVPDLPVGAIFRRGDQTILHIQSWDFRDDTFKIRIVKNGDFEERKDVGSQSLCSKLTSEAWAFIGSK